MARLPQPRRGERLEVKKRELPFSFWPVYKSERRYGLQTDLFAKNPWPVMAASIEDRCPDRARLAARAFLVQAEGFFRAAESDIVASRPLLLYYSFLNLAKALILTNGVADNLDHAKHGLREYLPTGGKEFYDAQVRAFTQTPDAANVFDLFSQSLGGVELRANVDFKVLDLFSQVVSAHRLWTVATDENDRFIPVQEVQFFSEDSEVWTVLTVLGEDLDRFDITHSQLFEESALSAAFTEVAATEVEGKKVLRFEQNLPTPFTDRPSDVLLDVVNICRAFLWPIVRSTPPYRKYYLYLAPDGTYRLHPLSSVYLIVFYLGSVTRYRPHHFEAIEKSPYAALVREVLTDEPRQFLYLVASEFAQRNVSSPAIL
jgi:hypothetical protein